MQEYFSYNFRRVITGDTKRFDIDLDVLNNSGQICFPDVQLFKTCWRTNFFKPLLKRSDAVVCRTESEHIIPESDTEKMADEAINATVAFFEQLGIKTRLSDYDLGDEAIAEVIRKLKEHGHIALGEHGKITAREAEALLKMAL